MANSRLKGHLMPGECFASDSEGISIQLAIYSKLIVADINFIHKCHPEEPGVISYENCILRWHYNRENCRLHTDPISDNLCLESPSRHYKFISILQSNSKILKLQNSLFTLIECKIIFDFKIGYEIPN